MALDYCTIIDEVLRRFPNVETDVKPYCLDLPHVVFESGFVPIIKECLKNDLPSKQSIFIFLEEMALSDDKDVRDLLLVSVLESLADDDSVRDMAKALMGNATFAQYLELGEYMQNI